MLDAARPGLCSLFVLAALGCAHDGTSPANPDAHTPEPDAGHRAPDAGAHDHDAASADAGRPSTKPDPSADSRAAVQATLEQNAACQNIKPFYWEIGDAAGLLINGSQGSGYQRNTQLEIASASKWLYAASYVQMHGGDIGDASEVKFLNFTSGFASIGAACLGRSVASCNAFTMNTAPGTTDAPGVADLAVDRFDYNSGHLEAHAERYGTLGSATAQTLGAAISSRLGLPLQLSYVNPLLAGGGKTSAEQYAQFLQAMLRGDLQLRALLGSHAVCTLSADYAELFHESCDAVASPWWPATSGKRADTADLDRVQNVHYSLGHWVESDGAFSSPGLYGFYPWIDATKTWYGLIARRQVFKIFDEAHPDTSAYAQSVQCGQALRAAWLDGAPHP
jgi:hypothetical protein